MIYLSRISLGVYLISWIFDKIVYQVYLIPYVPDIPARFKFYPPVAGAVFLASIGAASVLYLIRDGVHAGIRRMRQTGDMN